LADGDLDGLDRRGWIFKIAHETGTTVLALPFEAALEGDLPVAAMTQESSPAEQPCLRCSGSGTECEAVSALGERTLAALRGSDARFSGQGSRVDMQCTLCSGSGFVTAASADNMAWARNMMGGEFPCRTTEVVAAATCKSGAATEVGAKGGPVMTRVG
jgi:hypothetical protein